MWKYCDSIFQLGFFFILFFFLSFISFSSIHFIFFFPPHKCPVSYLYPPFFYFLFLLKNIPAISHLLHIREREYCTNRRSVEIEIAERTKLVEIGVYHAALPRPPLHRRSSAAPQIGLFFFFFLFSFFHICLLLFNFIVRIGFCFVFCVRIMWDIFWEWSKETETKMRGESNNCFLFSCWKFLWKKIHLELLQCSLY